MTVQESLSSAWNVSERVAALHTEALVCDMCLAWGPGCENQRTTLARFLASGVNFVSLTVGIDWDDLARTLHHMADVKARLRLESDKYAFVETVEDILRAKADGKLAVGFHFQGSEPLDGDANLIEVFYKLGVRHLELAYNQKNRAADGCQERTDCGLSNFGVSLIEEMNRVGMILDLSHTGYQSTMEAMEISTNPVIFSHSNAYALKKHRRNIRDDQIKACAKKAGVIGIVGLRHFLDEGEASTDNFVRHIDYVADLVGPQHVGIGLDFVYYAEQLCRNFLETPEKYPGFSANLEDWDCFPPERLPQLTEALLELRYSEDDIRGILGSNFLRIARQVWK